MPATALTYVFAVAAGKIVFGDPVGWDKLLGCALILASEALVARR